MKLRTILKIATVTSVILLCLGFAFSLYLKMSVTERAEDFDLYTLVPADSKVIVDTENLVSLMQHINELSCSKDGRFLYFSRFFVYLKEHINTLLEHTPHGLSRQMNKMLISFHAPGSDRDQVFYCRLGAGDYEFVEDFIRKYFSSAFPSRFFDYKGEEIRIYPMPDDTFLACYFTTEFLVVSYQKKLIEQVIDARIGRNSILSDKAFSKVREGNRVVAPATIYACMQSVEMGKADDAFRYRANLGGWSEFNVNLDGDAIYLSGINHAVDSCDNFVNTLRMLAPVEEFPGSILPESTFFFSGGSISNIDSVLHFTSAHAPDSVMQSEGVADGDGALRQFLKDYAGNVATACMFHSEDSLSDVPHAVLCIPLRDHSRAERALGELYNLVPHNEREEYLLPRNTIFTQLTGIVDSSAATYACVYNNRLLLAADAASMQAYMKTVGEEKAVLEGTPFYENQVASLSHPYNFMMVSDLGQMLDQPDGYARFIPNLFFRYDTFFRYFILTTQFTCLDDMVYPTLVLTYNRKEDAGN